MTTTNEAWAQVGDRISALCLKLKLHAEEELSDDEVFERAGLAKLQAVVKQATDAIGDAYEDEAVRSDARDVAQAVIAAVDATARDLRNRVQSS